ncbi:glyoxal oxidase N-terminus-domain-containing protein [Lentinula edodes]|uniref:glyoxal oxidase N-terminus-domain-containing protein n=1 Tax=Lentinula edodes TaxID=5353 RepID=UPI001E8D2DBB|nr:glyoxal oxidase N-terminus-domain-containing protein [Lentinula edodes]KAH7873641.1 glyoxal oxidase N-terminus-domain-containing protein [Lentinula edodes]
MNPRPSRSFLLFLICVVLNTVLCTAADEPAWNGHTPPGSNTPKPFTPYYVAPGAKGYSSSSPFIQYKGDWQIVYSPNFNHKAVHCTCQKQAIFSFSFNGTGVEWFGNCDKRHGTASVYIDKNLAGVVNTYCNTTSLRLNQRQFSTFSLQPGFHRLVIENSGEGCIDLNDIVVTRVEQPSRHALRRQFHRRSSASDWTLEVDGSTGVNAMQLAVISETHAIVIDKVEHNPLTINGHPAWASLFELKTRQVTPLEMQSNSFCAGGSFLSNGTLINVGGNPVVADHTSAADFGDKDGLQAIRIIEPCDDDGHCSIRISEFHDSVRMASPRWYNTVLRIDDGSAMIIGGSKKGGWINNDTVNNPTYEYYPPKDIHGSNGMPINSPFLKDTLNSNLFPIAFSLPDGRVFLAANNDAMIYDWKTDTEERLPPIPNGVRVTYPMTGTGLLLPLSSGNNYTPEVLLCGGSTVDDKKPGSQISSQDPASSQCSRMVLTKEGIQAGWEVDHMPDARLMPDAVLLPTGQIIIVNGAGSGISGYGNVVNQVGVSNAANPVLTPVLYNLSADLGSRFNSQGMPSSSIPRLYHSVATLTPDASIMIAGSNPNLDRSEIEYGTEYRVEWLSPPYMRGARPEIRKHKGNVGFKETSSIDVNRLKSDSDLKLVLMDLGFVTHSVHSNSRMVYLDIHRISGNTLSFEGPPSGGVYPPGPAFMFLVEDGVPSEGVKVMVGDGNSPEVNQKAIENVLKSTQPDQYEKSKGNQGSNDDDSE